MGLSDSASRVSNERGTPKIGFARFAWCYPSQSKNQEVGANRTLHWLRVDETTYESGLIWESGETVKRGDCKSSKESAPSCWFESNLSHQRVCEVYLIIPVADQQKISEDEKPAKVVYYRASWFG